MIRALLNKIFALFYFVKILCRDLYDLIFVWGKNSDRKLVHLDIEPTNICNANCVFCAYQYQDGERYKTIDFNFATKLLDSFCAAGGGDIGLTPIVGDPLVSKDLEKLVLLCRGKKEIKGIGITTNGILLTRDRFLDLKNAGLTDIVISMSYPDEGEYLRIYRSNNFQKLINNLNELMNLDKGSINITLAVRTPRLFWWNHPLFVRARKSGWSLSHNFFFDDWSGKVTAGLKEHNLFKRPLRGKHLPCTMLQSGPHALVSGKLTACGCRDLQGMSELADEKLFMPFYESSDLNRVYNETMDVLRNRFLSEDLPSICRDCTHYNPDFRFYSIKDKFLQLRVDFNATIKSIVGQFN